MSTYRFNIVELSSCIACNAENCIGDQRSGKCISCIRLDISIDKPSSLWPSVRPLTGNMLKEAQQFEAAFKSAVRKSPLT